MYSAYNVPDRLIIPVEKDSKARIRYNCTIDLLTTLGHAPVLSIENIICT